MAEFYKGFVFERDVSARLTIEGNPVPVNDLRDGKVGTVLPSGKPIEAGSVSSLARRYIVQSKALADRDRVSDEHFDRLRLGKDKWNRWRRDNPDVKPTLADRELHVELKDRTLAGYDFSYTNLCQAKMQGLDLRRANFHQAILAQTNLSGAHLDGANFCRTDLYETNFERATLTGANLQGVQMVRTNLKGANLRGCKVYGLSAWDLEFGARRGDEQLIVRYRPAYGLRANRGDEEVQVAGLDVAAFMYLTLHNRNIPRIIEAAGRRWVLLLGRFTSRKNVLTALADALRQRQMTPIIFDFVQPERKDLIETVILLAGMSAFVIVDITNPRSTPMELQAIASSFGVPVFPVIRRGAKEFATLSGLRKFPWVRPTIVYDKPKDVMAALPQKLFSAATAGIRS